MKSLSFSSTAALALLFLAPLWLPLSAASADAGPWICAKGTQIVTAADGNPYRSAGIGYGRDVIIRAQDDQVMKYCRDHSLNTVRLAFYINNFNSKPDRPIDIDAHIADFIEPVVQAGRKAGVYVVLDDHEYLSAKVDEAAAREQQKARKWDEAKIQHWVEGWTKVAEHFKDDPYVLGYELMNEPHDINPAEERELLTRCLKAIRAVDTRHLVVLSSWNWTHSRSMEATWGETASTVDAPYNNVAFSFHDYPQDDYPWKVEKNVTTFRDTHQVPVLCTEFGATHWNKSETVCREHETGLLAMCAKEGIGWMVWALGPELKDQPRNSYNEVDKVGLGPPRQMDSCAYTDLWPPVARITASPPPTPR